MPRNCGATSRARLFYMCPRCTGTSAGPKSWSWSASAACRSRNWRACAKPAPTSAPGRERRGDLLHAGVQAQFLPRRHAPRKHLRADRQSGGSRSTRRWTSASSARSTRATSTTWPRTSWRCSIATIVASRPCTWNPAGCRKARASTRWNPRSAPCASPSSTSRSRKSPSAPCCCGCSRSRGASTSRSSRSSSCCRRRLLNIEGLGRDLYPDLDIWKTAGPIMREWVREKMSGRAVLENARTQIPEILTSLQTLAPLVRSAVQRAQDGRLRLAVEAPEINALRNEIKRTNRRRDKVTIAAARVVGRHRLDWRLARDPAWPAGRWPASASPGFGDRRSHPESLSTGLLPDHAPHDRRRNRELLASPASPGPRRSAAA